MRKCLKTCKHLKIECPVNECRHWIDYEDDSNCTLIAVENHEDGKMTLREVSSRLGVSFVRVKQIEDSAIKKLSMYNKKNKIIE